MSITDQIIAAVRREVRRQLQPPVRWATVTQASPLQVEFPGDTASTPVSQLAGYAPTVGEQAVLLRVGRRWVAVGEVA